MALPLSEAKFNLWLKKDASDGQLDFFSIASSAQRAGLTDRLLVPDSNPAELHNSTTEKECLAIMWAGTHLRPYLEGKIFTVRTDHHDLRWVMNLADAQGRLDRWRLRLAEFDFQVEYSPNTTHHAADALSPLPNQPTEREEIDLDIPVLSVEEHALEPNTTAPIAKLLNILVPCLFERQCLESTFMHLDTRLTADTSVSYDSRGIRGT
jgi:RNase H-like domain found in reverse transcriptase